MKNIRMYFVALLFLSGCQNEIIDTPHFYTGQKVDANTFNNLFLSLGCHGDACKFSDPISQPNGTEIFRHHLNDAFLQSGCNEPQILIKNPVLSASELNHAVEDCKNQKAQK